MVTVLPVDGLDDERLVDFTRLTDVALRRRLDVERGLYLAESEKVLRRALAAGHRPRAALVSRRWLAPLEELLQTLAQAGAVIYSGPDEALEELTGFRVHRGLVASMHRPELPDVRELLAAARLVLVLEDIVDHTNVGAILRSAAGLGADAVLVTPRCADPLYRRAVRVSMGTVFQVPWTRLTAWPADLDLLRSAGFTVAALALTDSAVPLGELAAAVPERLALVLGTEGDGLGPATLAAADLHVRIPMAHGVDSLNVAAATAVALWALRRPGVS